MHKHAKPGKLTGRLPHAHHEPRHRLNSLDYDTTGVYDPAPTIDAILWPDSVLTADEAKAARNQERDR